MSKVTEQKHDEAKTGPSLEEMLNSEVVGGVTFASKIADFVDHVHAPTTKDGKADIKALIEHLMEGAKGYVQKHLSSDIKDPQWLPTAPAYQQLFETYQNPVVDGHLRKEVKDALVNLYETTAQNYIQSRATGRVNTSPLERGKKFAKSIAEATSNKFLLPAIEGAKEVEKLAARASQAISDLYTKARQWQTLYGNMNGFQPAYASAGTPAGKH